jgi:hypothetical protein
MQNDEAAEQQIEAWQARHENTPKRGAYWMIDAREADHAEALAEDAERATEVIHHVTRYSREISCGATGPVRVEEIAMRVNCSECKAADVAELTAEAERQAYAEDDERSPRCTAKINPMYPHIFEHVADVAADPEITPGHDTCGRDVAGHSDYTTERILDANWFQAVYDRAVDNTHGRLGDGSIVQARRELLDEAHAEAEHEDGERYAAEVIAGSRADQDAIALDLAAMVPADVDDAAAWEVYCKALPEPTDAQIADVLAEYGDPYAAARADAVAAFKDAARSIWKMRAAGQTDALSADMIRSLRKSMRGLRGCIEIFDQLTESWQQETRASAKRDSYTIRWDDGIVTTVPYSGRRS